MHAVAEDCLRRGVRARWSVRAENAGAIRFHERLGASVAIRGVCSWAVPAMRAWVAPDGGGAG